jgi:AcrR family transcriptional regulator
MDPNTLSRGERTRQDLLDSAYRLFIEQGYHGTSMRQIAAQAGLSLGGIYNHFPGKEALFISVLDRFHPYHDILPALSEAPGDTIEAFVRSAAERMVASFQDRPGYFNLIFIEIVEFEGRHLPVIFNQVLPQLEAILQRFHQTPGSLRPLPVALLLRAFIGLFFSHTLTDVLLAGNMALDRQDGALEGLVDVYLHGILERDEND